MDLDVMVRSPCYNIELTDLSHGNCLSTCCSKPPKSCSDDAFVIGLPFLFPKRKENKVILGSTWGMTR